MAKKTKIKKTSRVKKSTKKVAAKKTDSKKPAPKRDYSVNRFGTEMTAVGFRIPIKTKKRFDELSEKVGQPKAKMLADMIEKKYKQKFK